jgi:hypothetical protein
MWDAELEVAVAAAAALLPWRNPGLPFKTTI